MQSVSNPTISVVIPCYNGAKFLRETLDSVLAQTYPVLEVIVIDDGSTDDSAAIAESYGPPVRVIRQPNQGESVARNRGIDEAKGDWIAFLDADDLWLPEKLAEQVKLMHGAFDFISSGHVVVRVGDATPHFSYIPEPRNFSRRWIFGHGAPCAMSAPVVRKTMQSRFPTWTKYGEDMLYFLDLTFEGTCGIVSKPLVIYRVHSSNQSSDPNRELFWNKSLAEWLRRNQQHLEHSELKELAREHSRREKRACLTQALAFRQARRPTSSISLYLRVLVQSFFSPSSVAIVLTGLRGCSGALLEMLRFKSHPVREPVARKL